MDATALRDTLPGKEEPALARFELTASALRPSGMRTVGDRWRLLRRGEKSSRGLHSDQCFAAQADAEQTSALATKRVPGLGARLLIRELAPRHPGAAFRRRSDRADQRESVIAFVSCDRPSRLTPESCCHVREGRTPHRCGCRFRPKEQPTNSSADCYRFVGGMSGFAHFRYGTEARKFESLCARYESSANRRFPFAIGMEASTVRRPSVVSNPSRRLRRVVYACGGGPK
jgi:hypothetical protein